MRSRSISRQIVEFGDDREEIKRLREQGRDVSDLVAKWEAFPSLSRMIARDVARYVPSATVTEKNKTKSNVIHISRAKGYEGSVEIVQKPETSALENIVAPQVPQNAEAVTARHNLSHKDLAQFSVASGIIGEERNYETLVYGVLAGSNLGIESLAGSGKSALLNALLSVIPEEKYTVIHQATASSLYNDPQAAAADFWVIPELQKVFSRDIEEIIKNLTEGVASTYSRSGTRGEVETLRIEKKSVLYSCAITNRHIQKKDDEFLRRFIVLNTNVTRDHNVTVAQSIAERSFFGFDEPDVAVQEHVAYCLDQGQRKRNPFLPYVVEAAPRELSSRMRFRTAIKYVDQLMQGASIFRDPEDPFVGLQDAMRVIDLYGDILINNVYGMSLGERAVVDIIESGEKRIKGVRERFEDQYSLCFEESSKGVLDKGIISQCSGKYSLAAPVSFSMNPEYAFTHADDVMKEHCLGIRDQWYEINKKQMEVRSWL